MSLRSFSFFKNIVSILLLTTLALPTLSLYAQSVDDLKATVTSLNAQIDALDKEIQDYNDKISKTQGESKTLKQALATLELRRSKLLSQIKVTQIKIGQTQKGIEMTQGRITTTVSTIDRNHQGLSELLRRMDTTSKSMPLLVDLSAKNINLSDLIDGAKRSQDMSSQLQLRIADLKDAKLSLESTKTEYETQRQALLKLQSSLNDQRYLVEQNKTEKSKLLIETKNRESNYQSLLADRQKKKTQLEQEVLDYESKLSGAVDISLLPKYGKGVLQYPVDNVRITQYFGNTPFSTKNPQVYNGMGHNGVDFGVDIGTQVYTAAPGVVVGTGDTDLQCSGVSYGRWVLIRHANGLSTLYAHLSRIQVTAGQTLGVRQQIGLSGNTGYSTGPHVHFTVYASNVVHITGGTEYKSKVCGTYLIMPVAPRAGYLNPLSYL